MGEGLPMYFTGAVFANVHAEEFVDAVAIAGDEAVHLVAKPIHPRQVEQQPQREGQRQITQQAAHSVKSAQHFAIG